jgi:hypothetical protein
MLAKFGEGPYDGVVLHLERQLPEIIMPVTIRTQIKSFERTVSAQCLYRLVLANDFECRYQFEAIRV